MQAAVADLSHYKNINRRIAQSSAFFETVYACVNEAGVNTLGVRNFLPYV